MLITKVRLKNIKSFKEAELEFQAGVCVIGGENGAGKSTIFEAIGYALFGLPAEKFIGKAENFITLGKKSGEIEVHFTGSDGLDYFIVRKVGKGERRLFTKDKFELTGSLEAKLPELLGLSRERSLSEQFEKIIAPAQQDFLSPFNERRSNERSKAFEEILGISAWRELYKDTSNLPTLALNKIKGFQEQVALLEPQVADLEAQKQKLAEVQAELERESQKEDALRLELEQLKKQAEQGEEQRRRWEENQKQLALAENTLIGEMQRLPELEQDLGKAQTAAAILDKNQAAKDNFERLEAELKALAEQRLLKQKMEKAQQSLDLELKSLEAQIKKDRHFIATQTQRYSKNLEELQQILAELELKLKQQASLEEQALKLREGCRPFLAQLSSLNLEPLTAVKLKWENRQGELQELALEIQALEGELAAQAALEEQLKSLPELEAQSKAVTLELSNCQAELKQLAEGKTALSKGLCPFFKEACLNLSGKEPAEYFEFKAEVLQRQREEIETRLKGLNVKIEQLHQVRQDWLKLEERAKTLAERQKQRQAKQAELKEALNKFQPEALALQWQEKLPKLQWGDFIEQLQAFKPEIVSKPKTAFEKLEAAYRNFLQEQQTHLQKELAEKEELLKQCSNQRSQTQSLLEAKKEEAQKLHKELESLKAQELKLQADQEKFSVLLEQRAGLQAKLLQYQDLEEHLEEKEKTKEALKPLYDEYLANALIAKNLPVAKERLEKSNALIWEKKKQIQELQNQQQELKQHFSYPALEQLKQEVKLKEQEFTIFSEALKYKQKELEQLQQSVSQKEAWQAKILEWQSRIQEYQNTYNFLDFMRNRILKQVANRLAEGLRENISSYARRIYNTIAQKDEELYWDEGYALTLVDIAEGKIRKRRDQQLSAGQLMSAVIAMRLALLQAIGARLAFFDEPTSNLDAQRRQNLVEAFQNIEEEGKDWYDQLFLISHDTHFYEITSQRIELYLDKAQGSKVRRAE
jgi:exonuclease SbcC